MFERQRSILYLLEKGKHPMSSTVFTKMMFLIRHESQISEAFRFYDFLPYKFGPFSFMLYHELGRLENNGYLTRRDNRITLRPQALGQTINDLERLSSVAKSSVIGVISRYGHLDQRDLVYEVYSKYPWFAINSERKLSGVRSVPRPTKPDQAIYTVGYEGKTVDSFFNDLLERGIRQIIDVRANPVSRKYGFSAKRLGQLSKHLGMSYWNIRELGIPSDLRSSLGSYSSYQRLLSSYENYILASRIPEVREVAQRMRHEASVLVCFEKDVHCCHRSKLARAVAKVSGLDVIHI